MLKFGYVLAAALMLTFASLPAAIARDGRGGPYGGGGAHGGPAGPRGGGPHGASVGPGRGGSFGAGAGMGRPSGRGPGRPSGIPSPGMRSMHQPRAYGGPAQSFGRSNVPRGGAQMNTPRPGRGQGQFMAPGQGSGAMRPGGFQNRSGRPGASQGGNLQSGQPSIRRGQPSGGSNVGGRPNTNRGNMPNTPGMRGRGPGAPGQPYGSRGPSGQQYGHGNRGPGHQGDHYQPPRHSSGHYYYGNSGFYASPFFFGFWGFAPSYDSYYSPFFDYGFPYVYAPRAVIVQVPTYTYAPMPYYSYGNDYYLSQGSYTGLDAAINDIKNGWMSGNADLILRHVESNTEIAIYLNGGYSYSLSGSDYRAMVRDAIKHIRTAAFTVTNLEERSDGAYTLLARHELYDVNNNYKAVDVSYTLAQSGANWVIVATGSSAGT